MKGAAQLWLYSGRLTYARRNAHKERLSYPSQIWTRTELFKLECVNHMGNLVKKQISIDEVRESTEFRQGYLVIQSGNPAEQHQHHLSTCLECRVLGPKQLYTESE